jgi:hypothetical protein
MALKAGWGGLGGPRRSGRRVSGPGGPSAVLRRQLLHPGARTSRASGVLGRGPVARRVPPSSRLTVDLELVRTSGIRLFN